MLIAFQDWGPGIKVVTILVAAVVLTIVVRRLVTRKVTKMLTRFGTVSVDPVREAARVQTLSSVIRSTLVGAIWIIAFLGVFQIVNTTFKSFVLAVTLLGSALTFGAQSLIRDVLSGFFILIEDQYAVGDLVDLGLAKGRVERVTLRVTRLRDAEGKVWWVPNGQIARAGNFTQDWARAVVDVALTRDSDVDEASAVIADVAERTLAQPDLAGRCLEPPRVLGIQEISDHRMVIRLSVKVDKDAEVVVKRAIQAALLVAFHDGRLVGPPMLDHPGPV